MLRLLQPLRKFEPSRNSFLVAYKLTVDLLFLGLVFFVIAMTVEAVLPGLVSEKISFFRIIVFLSIIILAAGLIAQNIGIKTIKNTAGRKTLTTLMILSALLAVNSFLNLTISLNVLFVILLFVAGYFTYRLILDQ